MSDKTALVLAGGGSLGAVQVGMLQALTEEHVTIDLVVGASVGAINGAFFASQPNAVGAAELAEIWCGLGPQDIFPFSLLSATKALLQGRGHLLTNEGLSRLIQTVLPVKSLEECLLPLHVVTTDLLSGAEVLQSQGNILDALLASAAIPLVYPPIEIAGRLLVDGGVASNTPIASAVALGATRIVVLPTGFGCACKAPPKGFVALALHTLNLMSMRQLIRDIELHDRRVRIHVAAPLCPLGVSVFDFTQTRDLIERARVQTQAWLRAGGLDQTGVPDSLRAHSHPEMTDE
ncbi:patatin-like phospholipase family protein [Pseudomonas aeruginosa]|uniref:patatin-like phospholipase family protein n=1 Tax=Pseudomonas aeruginosa TaxID=287 RepID=UPI001C95CD3A|nr:patatin-like phospholipase family protein [Pseudomonas aeruginosa]WAJ81447.1 patatin-like phospholipase family protein [Pseudomonas aeruginosa]HBO1414530.1 patatin-like phospholipase family protein [Pseudomonas aeruginosa]HBO3807465.1 patatin-like phospholipase family protein [Pseudomonas aeruginosa]HCL3530007.1 patatin-like phospholipase family protein [Pseudomonas aeruginosa]